MFTRLLLGISLVLLLLGHSALAEEQFRVGHLYAEEPGKVLAVVELPPGVTAKPADFQLLLDNKPPITAYDMRPVGDVEKGLNVILCIDISGSMAGPTFAAIKEPLQRLLSDLFRKRRPHDRIGLITFGTNIKIVMNFGELVGSIEKPLRAIDNFKSERPESKTRLYQALDQALDYFQPSEPPQGGSVPQRQHIVVITDGKDEGSSVDLVSVITKSKDLGVSIDTVGWGKIAEPDLQSLQLLAKNTGGIFIDARTERLGISDALKRLYRELTETHSFVVYFNYPVATEATLTEQVAVALRGSQVSNFKAKLPMPAGPPGDGKETSVTTGDGKETSVTTGDGKETSVTTGDGKETSVTTGDGKETSVTTPIPNWLIGLLAALLAILITGLIIGIGRRKTKPALDEVQPEIMTPAPFIAPVAVPVVTGEGPREARRTRMSVYFPPPGPGRPAALLVGLSGSVEGREFSMEQELLRLGASPDNDIVIENDDYVSNEHASLRYEKGSLLVLDQNSRNGTFVNDIRLADTAWPLTPRDRIRIGNATFEVVFPATP